MALDSTTSMPDTACMPRSRGLTDQIRQAVKDCGESRYQLSKELEIDQAALSRFVRGERGLSLDAIDRLAAHLGLRITSSKRKRKKS